MPGLIYPVHEGLMYRKHIVSDRHYKMAKICDLSDDCYVAKSEVANDDIFNIMTINIIKWPGTDNVPIDNISLTLAQCVKLEMYADEIDDVLSGLNNDEYMRYLGYDNNVRARRSPRQLVDIRKFVLPHGEQDPLPSESGVMLNMQEWIQLKIAMRDIFPTEIPEITSTGLCDNNHDHSNLMVAIACPNCTSSYF